MLLSEASVGLFVFQSLITYCMQYPRSEWIMTVSVFVSVPVSHVSGQSIRRIDDRVSCVVSLCVLVCVYVRLLLCVCTFIFLCIPDLLFSASAAGVSPCDTGLENVIFGYIRLCRPVRSTLFLFRLVLFLSQKCSRFARERWKW